MAEGRDVLLVVFGAGASYDCLPQRPPDGEYADVPAHELPNMPFKAVRPPLANDIAMPGDFRNQLISRYGECRPLIAELQRRRDEGIEPVLADLIRRRQADPRLPLQVLAFRYYLRDLFAACGEYMLCARFGGGVTNYTHLVGEAVEWLHRGDREVCFVTFNYDVLLARAIEDATGSAITAIRPQDQPPTLKLLHPHGSVAWEWRPPNAPVTSLGPTDAARHVLESGELVGVDLAGIQVTAENLGASRLVPRAVGIPAVALPLDEKVRESFVWPQEQFNYFKGLQGRVSRLAIVGWRGADSHFVPLLEEAAGEDAWILLVTGGADAEKDADFLRSQLANVGNPARRAHRRARDIYLDGFAALTSDAESRDPLGQLLSRAS